MALAFGLILMIIFMSEMTLSFSFSSPSLRSTKKCASTLLKEKKVDEIGTISTNNFAEDFMKCGSWNKNPILLKDAFKLEAKLLGSESSCWPSWDEVITLASDEDAEARIITHNPRDPHSWELDLGPIEGDFAQDIEADGRKWTVVVNDVDRFHPSLSDWIEKTFSIVPQWRRDDGQISLSQEGGGIGPHVDDYDVFLIQMKGRRCWEVGKRAISSKEEVEGLIDGIDVRILDFWEDEVSAGLVQSFTLEEGDVLYLPPRYGHCGTALLDNSMTLSVGLRAPSAKDLMTKIMEYISDSNDEPFVTRYTDPDLFHNGAMNSIHGNRDEISKEIKSTGKHLVKSAINRLLDDDILFDELFGKLVTQSNRVRWDYPTSLDSMDDESKEELGPWGNADSAISGVFNGEGVLYAAEGIAWAYSIVEIEGETIFRLFIDGRKWELAFFESDDERDSSIDFLKKMVEGRQMNRDLLQIQGLSKQLYDLMRQLVHEGYLYADG